MRDVHGINVRIRDGVDQWLAKPCQIGHADSISAERIDIDHGEVKWPRACALVPFAPTKKRYEIPKGQRHFENDRTQKLPHTMVMGHASGRP